MIKRLLDFGLAALGLFILFPLLLIIAAWVLLDSPGPVFFRHERIGRRFQPFLVVKFRTMTWDPRKNRDDFHPCPGSMVTRAGTFLRAWKLDELPQLWNVLKGEMSLVGPRPEVGKYVFMFKKENEEILSVRPGLTGPGSLKYRNEEELLARAKDPEREYVKTILPDKIRMAKEYVRGRSLIGDLWILGRTAMTVLGRGR